MSRFNRRRFLEGLGLGVSSPLLAPITNTLLSEAHGQPLKRRLAVFFVVGETVPTTDFTPPGIEAGSVEKYTAVDRSGITLPPMLNGMAKFQDRTILLDGLYNQLTDRIGNGGSGGVQHGSGWGCLTGTRPDGNSPEYGGTPTSVSIDQFVAQKIGGSTPIPSVLIGFNGGSAADTSSTTFSAGSGRPLAHIGRPTLLYDTLFGKRPTTGSATPSAADAAARAMQTSLLDSMRDDIRRLNARLAASEKARLGEYLQIVDDFDKKQAQLAQVGASCGQPPQGMDGTPAQRLESMMAMGGLALRCGLTNVLGVSIGSGFNHDDLQLFKADIFEGSGYGGHGDPALFSRSMTKLYQFNTKLIAQLLTDLGALADSTVVMMVTASGTTNSGHHANLFRWISMVYDGTGTLKTAPGGRYIRYGRSQRSTVDLYCSVAHAAGAPTDKFGGGYNVCKGPLPELMA
jgi:hypothetical protein